MKAPSIKARKALRDIDINAVTEFVIPGTKKKVRIGYIHPYTLERMTEVWGEVEETKMAHNTAETLKYACKHTIKPHKEAVLYSLNSYWKIRLFYRIRLWWWLRVRQFSVEQMNAVIAEGKKKIVEILHSYYENMALTLDMREDWMKMTTKEAEQYQAELLSVAGQLSSKSIRSSGTPEGSSSD